MISIRLLLFVTRIVAFLISLGFIVDRSKKFFQKGERQTFLKYAASLVVWVIVIFSTFYSLLFQESNVGFLLIFYMLIFAFALIFRLLNMIERIEDKITRIVKHQALHDLKMMRKHVKK